MKRSILVVFGCLISIVLVICCVIIGMIGLTLLSNQTQQQELAHRQDDLDVSAKSLQSNESLSLEEIECDDIYNSKEYVCLVLQSPLNIEIRGIAIEKESYDDQNQLFKYFFFKKKQIQPIEMSFSAYVTDNDVRSLVKDFTFTIGPLKREYVQILKQSGERSGKTNEFMIPENAKVKIEFSINNNQIYGIESYVSLTIKSGENKPLEDSLLVNEITKQMNYSKEFETFEGKRYISVESNGKWEVKVYSLQNV